jgi:hypothetical protein
VLFLGGVIGTIRPTFSLAGREQQLTNPAGRFSLLLCVSFLAGRASIAELRAPLETAWDNKEGVLLIDHSWRVEFSFSVDMGSS